MQHLKVSGMRRDSGSELTCLGKPGRIHFSVHFPKLDRTARRTIWSMFFTRASIEVDDTELDRLASREINGRQVRCPK